MKIEIPEEVFEKAQYTLGDDWPFKDELHAHLEAVFASMSPEQLREFASSLITEANRREGYGE